MTYRAILFDFFGVICDERYWRWVSVHIPDYEKRRDYFQGLADRADRGDVGQAEVYDALGQEAGVEGESIQRAIYQSIRLHKHVLDIIAGLRRSYKTGIVSNADYRELERIIGERHLNRYFDEVVVSSQVKLIKPDPKIFELACQRLGVEPTQALFVDDREENIVGAEDAGMKGVLFSDVAALKHSLRQYGISVTS